MLSKLEAILFLCDILGLNTDILESTDRRDVINTIMKAYTDKEPFQNITLLAIDPKERHRPTCEEIKRGMFLQQGGLCYSHHIFLYALFKSLNFDSALAHGGVSGPGNHLVVLLKKIEQKGDLFLLESACGYPTFQIIPLDFEDESPVYFESFLEYKFIKKGDKILRMHRNGDIRPPVDNGFFIGEWRRFYDFELREAKCLDEFDKMFEHVYTDHFETPFHSSVRFVSFRNQKAKILVNYKTLVENDKKELVKIELNSDADIVKSLQLFTDAFDESVIRKALDNWLNLKITNSVK